MENKSAPKRNGLLIAAVVTACIGGSILLGRYLPVLYDKFKEHVSIKIERTVETNPEENLAEKVTQEYDERFPSYGVSMLKEHGISPEMADAYNKKYSYYHISKMHEAGVPIDYSNDLALLLDEFLIEQDVIKLYKTGVPIDYILSLKGRNYVELIISAYNSGISAEYLNSFPRGLYDSDIHENLGEVLKSNIDPKLINEYYKINYEYDVKINLGDILFFIRKGYSVDYIRKQAERVELEDVLRK